MWSTLTSWFYSSALIEDWRILQWGDKEKDLQLVKKYQPQNKEVKQLRVLLHGPVAAGKSSFINSVESVLQGRITGQALTDANSQKSFTRKHTTYKIYKQPGVIYPFVFTDTMGLEAGTDEGVCVEDIILAMKGHIKEGYNFDPQSVISEDDPNYNKEPTLEDKVHVLVCVIDANTLHILGDNNLRKMREVRLAASDMGIPQVAILTKIDEACPEVKINLRNAFKSKYLKEQMDRLSATLGLQPNLIFPVKNYHSEVDVEDDVDAVILIALKRILDSGDEFLNHQ